MTSQDEAVIEACFSEESLTKLTTLLQEGGSPNAVDVMLSSNIPNASSAYSLQNN